MRVKQTSTPEEELANSTLPILHPVDAKNVTAVKNLVANGGAGKTPNIVKNEKAVKKAEDAAVKLEETKRAREAML